MIHLRTLAHAGFVFALSSLSTPLMAATTSVSNAAELIAAITAANDSVEDDIIDLGGNTITLTSVNNSTNGNNGLPVLLAATSAGKLTIQNGTITRNVQGQGYRFLSINSDADITLDKLGLIGGLLPNTNTPNTPQNGGAISNAGTLTIKNSTLSGNRAGRGLIGSTGTQPNNATGGTGSNGGNGGAIHSSGTLTIMNSTFSNNTAGNGGSGGIAAPCTVQFKTGSAGGNGGNGGNGGAIHSSGALSITNSTFTGNTPGTGGIGGNGGHNGCTTNGPNGANGAAGTGASISRSTDASLTNTILHATTDNCGGSGNLTGSHNLATDTSCGTGLLVGAAATTAVALNLDTLKNNSGVTQTIALLDTSGTGGVKSAAIDAGDAATCAAAAVNNLDQRGAPRPSGTACDVGAFEYNSGIANTSDSNKNPVIITATNGVLANVVQEATNPAGALSGYTYPHGFFSFDVNVLTAGDTATVKITLPNGSTPNAYVKCNTAGTTCSTFPGAVINGNVVTLTLVDGGAGDADGATNSVIKDPGAPTMGSGPVAARSGGGEGGSLDWLLLAPLMGLASMALWRRRRAH